MIEPPNHGCVRGVSSTIAVPVDFSGPNRKAACARMGGLIGAVDSPVGFQSSDSLFTQPQAGQTG